MKLTDTQVRGLATIATQYGLSWFIRNGFNVIVDNGTKNGLRPSRTTHKVNSIRQIQELIIFGGNDK
jgi:hypothetical protein